MNTGLKLSLRRKVSNKLCLSCREPFSGIKIAKYCSNKCKQATKYQRNKLMNNRVIPLSVALGMSSAYDWSNININQDTFILRVLEGCDVEDITRCIVSFGVTRVGAQLKRINDALVFKIAARQYSNICGALND